MQKIRFFLTTVLAAGVALPQITKAERPPMSEPSIQLPVVAVEVEDYPTDDQYWDYMRGGGIGFVTDPTPAVFEDFELTRVRPWSAGRFSTDLSPAVFRVEIGKIEFEKVEVDDGRRHQYKQFMPGDPHYPMIVFNLVPSTEEEFSEINDWVKEIYDGHEIRKDITITIKKANGDALSTIALLDCTPSYWSHSVADSLFKPMPADMRLETRCNRVTMDEPDGQSGMDAWLSYQLQNPGGEQKDVEVWFENASKTYFDSFIQSYEFPVLDSRYPDRPLRDVFNVTPGYFMFTE